MTPEIIFDSITAPLQNLLKKEAEQLRGDSSGYKLSLYFFTMNLVYAIIKKIPSIALLVTEIKTSSKAQELGLVKVSASMYSEAFGRYDPQLFRRIFMALLEQLDFLGIPEIKSLVQQT